MLIVHFNRRAQREVDIPSLKDYAATGTGLNLRMHPFAVDLIIEQLKMFKQQIKERTEVAEFMIKEISNIEELKMPQFPDQSSPFWYSFPILFNEKKNQKITLLKSHEYHNFLIKLSTWYGNNRFNYAMRVFETINNLF